MPGTWVDIGLNSPRISAGALGFRSNVSSWEGPPQAKMRMHDFGRAFGLALSAASSWGSASPRVLSAPAQSHSRRSGAAIEWRLAMLTTAFVSKSNVATAVHRSCHALLASHGGDPFGL